MQIRIVLASASPRRAELLDQIGVGYDVRPANIDESVQEGEIPADYVARMAREKALAVSVNDPDFPVLAADTSVVLADRILGKPGDKLHAESMLAQLSGRCHQVITAVAVACRGHCEVSIVATDVEFRALTPEEITAYVGTGEPMDKAGSYGIQGRGGIFVERINGSYSAVVGLPLAETAALLEKAGVFVTRSW